MLMVPLSLFKIQPPNVQDSTNKYVHCLINTNFIQGSICIVQDSTTLRPCMHYSPNCSAYISHGLANNAQGSINRTCGSTSTNNVHGAINVFQDSTSKGARLCHQYVHGFINTNFIQDSICIVLIPPPHDHICITHLMVHGPSLMLMTFMIPQTLLKVL